MATCGVQLQCYKLAVFAVTNGPTVRPWVRHGIPNKLFTQFLIEAVHSAEAAGRVADCAALILPHQKAFE